QGVPVRYVSVFHDITELRRKDEHIRHIAFHDALTGLPNRALLQDRLQHAIHRARREGSRLAVTFVDLDRFKAINDNLGHDLGDLLLQRVARRIRGRLRAVDTAARMGGDEFVILMEDLREAGHCANLAGELIADISRPMDLRGHRVQVGASMGMAFFPEDGDDAVELMKRADLAMYAAKAAGRNTYRFFQQEMLDKTSERLKLEMELGHAIAGGELELHYQPQIALATGQALGLEALVRWRHPKRGFLPPADFIPLAEESGLIVALGDWVLEEACRQAAAWQARGCNIKIAVNISARQLGQGNLAEQITDLTARHGITPTALEIELTESAVMADPEHAAGLLARLRQIGVTVAVDDFGTGYSSLAYLRRLPIDVLKIDRSFIMDAERNEDDVQIVKTILALGQTLKLAVVAEGIETERQAQLLQSIGCDVVQGYLFSRPLPAQEIEDWLAYQP
ncbi:MAG: EAL domain-containing protein, partial [Betaproteobacteria bacterium]|nr:EAL domain-containing protein [Betaproteobacteria bacterium]